MDGSFILTDHNYKIIHKCCQFLLFNKMEQVKNEKSTIVTRGQRGATCYLNDKCNEEEKSEIAEIWKFTG